MDKVLRETGWQGHKATDDCSAADLSVREDPLAACVGIANAVSITVAISAWATVIWLWQSVI
jgi:hypothetical protein